MKEEIKPEINEEKERMEKKKSKEEIKPEINEEKERMEKKKIKGRNKALFYKIYSPKKL